MKIDYKEKLMSILKSNPKSLKKFSVDIGIDIMSLRNYMNGRTTPAFKNELILKNYLEKYHREIKNEILG